MLGHRLLLAMALVVITWHPANGHTHSAVLESKHVLQLAQLLLSERALTPGQDHHVQHEQHDHQHGHDHQHDHELVSVEDLALDTPDELQAAVARLVACAQDAHCRIQARNVMVAADKTSDELHPWAAWAWLMGPTGVTPFAKVLAAGLLFIETVLGMFVPPLLSRFPGHRWWLGLLNAYSGGIFVAAGLIHLIPHCLEAEAEVNLAKWGLPSHYPLALLLIVVGYLVVFFVERVLFEGHDHHHGHDEQPNQLQDAGTVNGGGECNNAPGGMRKRKTASKDPELSAHVHTPACEGVHSNGTHSHAQFNLARGLPLLVGMSVHTALEALALGLTTRPGSFWILFLAVAAHKGVSALALSARFMRDGATMRQVMLLVGPFTLVAPCSIALGAWAGASLPAGPQLVLNCMAAGTFLYVGANEVLAEEFEGDVRAGRRDLCAGTARAIKFMCVIAAVLSIAAMGLLPHVH